MIQVAGLGARSLFLSFVLLYFVFFSSSPIRASIARIEVDGFGLCSDPYFLRSFLPVSFLGVVAHRPRGSVIRYISNK